MSDHLQALFLKAEAYFTGLLDTIRHGIFLPEDIRGEIDPLLSSILQEQTQSLQVLQEEDIELSDPMSLDELTRLEAQFAQKREQRLRVQYLQTLTERFLSLRAIRDEYRIDLVAAQAVLRDFTGEALAEPENMDRLGLYEKLLELIGGAEPDRNTLSALYAEFGPFVMRAASRGDFVLTEPISTVSESEPEEPAAPEEPASVPEPEEPAAPEESASVPEPEESAVPEEPASVPEPEEPAAPEEPASVPEPEEPAVPEETASVPEPEEPAAPEEPASVPEPEEPAVPEEPASVPEPEEPAVPEEPASVPEPEEPAAPEETIEPEPVAYLHSTRPIRKQDPKAASFQRDYRALPVDAAYLLPLLSHFAVLDTGLLVSLARQCHLLTKELSDDEALSRVRNALDQISRRNLVAEYPSGNGSLFCLTDYCFSCMQLASIRDSRVMFVIPAKGHMTTRMSIGAHRYPGRERIPRDEALGILARNARVVRFLEIAESAFSAEQYDSLVDSLRWKSGRFVVKLPFRDAMLSGEVCFGPESGESASLTPLYLTDELPAVSEGSDQPVFFCDGSRLQYYFDGWHSFGEDSPTDPEPPEGPGSDPDGTPADEPAKSGGESPVSEAAPGEEDPGAPEAAAEDPFESVVEQAFAEEPEAVPAEEPGSHPEDEVCESPVPEAPVTVSEDIPPEETVAPAGPERITQFWSGNWNNDVIHIASPEDEYVAESLPSCFLDDQQNELTDSGQIAAYLLAHSETASKEQLLLLLLHLIAEERMPQAAALSEMLAEAPGADSRAEDIWKALRISMHVPGTKYYFNSGTIERMQARLPNETGGLKQLHQTAALSVQLWSMFFPDADTPFDHNLYNNAGMLVTEELGGLLGSALPELEQLLSMLSGDLKELSFQNDGLGFSADVIGSLSDDGERRERVRSICDRADDLRRVPTSTVSITGLETCLKYMVGPSSELGQMIELVSQDARGQSREIRRRLTDELQPEPGDQLEQVLEQYIDRCWDDIRNKDKVVRVKRINPDSPARRVCKKALFERVSLIEDWLAAVNDEQNSRFQQSREKYTRLLNQLRTQLEKLSDRLLPVSGAALDSRACRALLRDTVVQILNRLNGGDFPRSDFYGPLLLMPEMLLSDGSEPVIIPELYSCKGLEPWVPMLAALTESAVTKEQALLLIDDIAAPRWYRSFSTERGLHALDGTTAPDRTADAEAAKDAARKLVDDFKSETRLSRAYGKIREHLMETVFSILDVVEEEYLNSMSFAAFRFFVGRLKSMVREEIRTQAETYEQRVKALKAEPNYADAQIFEVIDSALGDQNFVRAEAYINCLINGQLEADNAEVKSDAGMNYLALFQSCEDAYYRQCQLHKGEQPGQWGENVLRAMGSAYQRWSSASSNNESKNAYAWLKNWVLRADSPSTMDRVKSLISGLGFKVIQIERGQKTRSSAEVFKLHVEPVSTARTDYAHPVYPFGTRLSDPMNVVCLYGCKGASTVINVMTSELQLSGSTIVLMDGTLNSADRHRMAEQFKSDTSHQNPFLLIDRVLLLFLASLDEGVRQRAMLSCTLPYTFEVLYGNGSDNVPEEMFIGRVSEMADLRSTGGANLVYGGRQLGKTALLNRASKTLHRPESKEYSFCVEVKDQGSERLLVCLNRELRRLKLISADQPSLQELCEELTMAWQDGRFHRLQVFIDEVDVLFEEFKKDNFKSARPFIKMRQDTSSSCRFVFAGTHNVADTSLVEQDNSNLLHWGTPLCIEPLSSDDAAKLIQRPMTYLGFEIGHQQIELILSSTNSYPGLIHMFCKSLVESVCRNYSQYYSDAESGRNPPYRISDEQMRAVFRDNDIRKEISKRVMATISLNRKYHAVACILAALTYENQKQLQPRIYGYSAEEIRTYNERECRLPFLSAMSLKDLGTVLDEMVRMAILWKNDDTMQYRFRQKDFRDYIGTSEDEVMDKLLKLVEEAEVGNAG